MFFGIDLENREKYIGKISGAKNLNEFKAGFRIQA